MNSIGTELMEKTKFQYRDRSDQSNNLTQPPLEAEYDASRPVIDLPRPENIKIRSLDLDGLLKVEEAYAIIHGNH
jgi:hypothetical protein